MDINSWFANSGTYEEGLTLLSQLPTCNAMMLRKFQRETPSTFLQLKYELKKASMGGMTASVEKAKEVVPASKKPAIKVEEEPLLQTIIQQSADVSFHKEHMGLYPAELHSVYRERISNFYKACELKFQLNAVPDREDSDALKIILQLEDLWTKIDKAWMILDHWKDHNRMMPVKCSEDFAQLSPVKIVLMRNNLEAKISKRQKTIDSMYEKVKSNPEDRLISNAYNRKLEQLHQLQIDLETVRNLLQNE
jgi:hypothetical protein